MAVVIVGEDEGRQRAPGRRVRAVKRVCMAYIVYTDVWIYFMKSHQGKS